MTVFGKKVRINCTCGRKHILPLTQNKKKGPNPADQSLCLFFGWRIGVGRCSVGLCFLIHVVVQSGNELPRDASLPFALDVKETNDAEDQGTDKIDHQILHGIEKTNIEIGGEDQLLSVSKTYDHLLYALYINGGISFCLVKDHSMKALNVGIILHISVQKRVASEFKKFPQHANGHGKTKSNKSKEKGRQLEFDMAVTVDHIQKCKSKRGKQKTIYRVKNGIPMRNFFIITVDLSQNLRGKDKQQNDTFKKACQMYLEILFHKSGNHKLHQCQKTDKNIGIFAAQKRSDKGEKHKQAEKNVHRHKPPAL